ncbi:MAG: hypothetical protein JXR68_11885 [Bacteroidales bacterium]|nr:hypothetical protein [Bacteroidales bacterium]
MKKNIYLTIIILLLYSNLYPQNNIGFCGYNNSLDTRKYPWKGNNQFLLDYIKNYPLLDSSRIYYYVPICFHIYKNSKISEANFYDDIKNVMGRLNYTYISNKTGLFFYISDIVFYDEPNHFIVSYYTEAPFISNKNKHPFSINVYYIDVLQSNFLGNKNYYQGVFNPLTNSITVIKHSSKTTLAHEIGHFFGLKHPHYHSNRSKLKQESVSRTRTKGFFKKRLNCEVNGDYLADTPAEPDLSDLSDSDCNYTGNITDNWGDKYNPNVNNIMSYTANRACRTNFTLMQRAAMLYTAENFIYSYLWKNCDQNIHFTVDAFEPDDNIYQSNEISTLKQYHSFNLYPARIVNQLKYNNIDWFSVPASFLHENTQIEITKAYNVFPEMNITAYNHKFDTVFNASIKNDTVFYINNFGTKINFKIECVSPPFTGILYDYFIDIKIFENP